MSILYWNALFNLKMFCFVFFRGRKIFEPPRFMSVSQAAQQFLEIVSKRTNSSLTSESGILLLYFLYLFANNIYKLLKYCLL